MTTSKRRSHKHLHLDSAKIKRVQKVLRAKTETEAIDRALDLVIAEHKNNRLALEASERFLKSGIIIRDIYGTLGVYMPPTGSAQPGLEPRIGVAPEADSSAGF